MSLQNAFPDGVDRVIQNELVMEADTRMSLGGTKIGDFLRPEGPISGYQGGQIVRFRFPSQGILDFRNHALTFGAVASKTGGADDPVFPKDIRGIISRVVIKLGGQIVEDRIRENVFTAMNSYANDPDWETTQANLLLGYTDNLSGGVDNRETRGASTSRRYAVQFEHGLLANKILPMSRIPEMVIEVHLEQTNNCMFDNGTATGVSYAVNDLKLHYDLLELGQDYEDYVDSKIANGLPLVYRTFTHYEQSSITGATESWQIPVKVTALQQVWHVLRNRADITDVGVDEKLSTFNPVNFESFRLRVQNQYFPQDRIEGFQEAWLAVQDAWSMTPRKSARGASTYESSSFILGQQLDPHQGGTASTGLNTADGSSSVIAELTLGGAPAATQVADNFMVHENAIVVRPGRNLTFYR